MRNNESLSSKTAHAGFVARFLGVMILFFLCAPLMRAQQQVMMTVSQGAQGTPFQTPQYLAFDSVGNLFVSDTNAARIQRIDKLTGAVTTVAGTGASGFSGDGGPATAAQLNCPYGLAFGKDGSLLIADSCNYRIRKVAPGPDGLVTGNDPAEIITTIAGDGNRNTLGFPYVVVADQFNNLFIASGDGDGSAIFRVDASSGQITWCFTSLYAAVALIFDASGDLLISESADYGGVADILMAKPGSPGAALTGKEPLVPVLGPTGDSGYPLSASIEDPYALSMDATGALYVSDYDLDTILKITPGPDGFGAAGEGSVVLYAGTPGTGGYTGDGGLPLNAQLSNPVGIAINAAGNLFVADYSNHVVRGLITGTTTDGTKSVVPLDQNGNPSPLTLAFTAGATQSGYSAVVFRSSAPPLPAGLQLAGTPPLFYDVATTAKYAAPLTVCFNLNPVPTGTEVLHFNQATQQWEDKTVEPVPLSGPVCAQVQSLSPFAVVTTTSTDVAVAANPASLNFGSQNVQIPGQLQIVTVTSTGVASATFGPSTLSGLNPGDFAITSDACSGLHLPNGGTCQISVVFTPTAFGARAATLQINDNATDSPQTVSLRGNGASLSVTPSSLDFGSETQGFTTSPVSVTVTNGTAAPVTIVSASFTGANPGDFADASDSCTGVVLASQASCTFDVTFTPAAVGSRSATLSISSTAADSPRAANLSGTGIAPVVVASVSPGSFDFGSVTIGSSSQALGVSLTNSGTAPLIVTSVALTGNHPRDFVIASDTCTGATLAPSQNCALQITFVPMDACNMSASVSITDNSPNSPQSVSLTGIGNPGALAPFQSILYCTSNAAEPQDLSASVDGHVWFDEFGSIFAPGALGMVSTADRVHEEPNAVYSGWRPSYLTIAPDGSYAYMQGRGAGYSLYLDVVSAAGVKDEYLPSGNAGPMGLGPDGAFWYSNSYSCPNLLPGANPVIGRYLPGQAPVNYEAGFYWLAAATNHYCIQPSLVTAGPDGTVWIGLTNAPAMPISEPPLGFLRMSTNGVFVDYIPTDVPPSAAAIGSDGGLYVLMGNQHCTLEKLDAAGSVTALPLSTSLSPTTNISLSSCASIASGPDGLLWMIGSYWNGASSVPSMVSFNPSTGAINSYPAPATRYLTAGPDEGIWFSTAPSDVGRFDLGGGPAAAFVTPKVLALSSTPAGVSSGSQQVTMLSSGTGPLTISSISLGGANPDQFIITDDECTAKVLAPGASCTVLVASKPSQYGSHLATLLFNDDSKFSPQTVRLAEFTLPPPPVVSPAALTFPATAVGAQSATQTLTLSNPWTKPVPVSSVGLVGANPADFAITAYQCPATSVPAGGSCTVTVQFAPTASGTRTATVSFTDAANPPIQTASLTGSGTSGGTGGSGGGSGSCNCAIPGPYVDPVQGVDVSGDPKSSPTNKFIVTSSIDNTNNFSTLTVTRRSDGQVLLPDTTYPITVHWGFSPDENRLAIHSVDVGTQEDEIWVYDLSVAPTKQIVHYRLPVLGDRLQFSPSGQYFLLMALTSQGRSEIDLYRVAGVSTEERVFQTTFSFQSVPGVDEDSFGTETWGFSPDKPESSFVYAYGNGQSTVSLNVANLTSPHLTPVLNGWNITGVAGFWQYNPCGNLLGVVWQPSPSQVEVDLFNTSDGSKVGKSGTTFPVDFVALSSNGITEQATVGSDAPFDIATNPTCSPNTPAGTNITVPVVDPATGTTAVTITFANVNQSGETTVLTGSSPPNLPTAFDLGNPPTYYEITTTAGFSGTATVCINYSGISFTGPPALNHFVNGAWVDITTNVDTVNHIVCGTTNSFSPFALFQPDQSPAITSASSASFTAGTFSTFTATASGVPAPALSEAGSLPAGVSFLDNGNGTASLLGIAISAGSYPFTLTASNSGGSVTQSFVLNVDQTPAITSPNTATFTVGAVASFKVTATGFPAPTFSESGALPGGTLFDPSTGTFSGVPSAGGTFAITLTASSSVGSATQSFTLTVNQGPAITSAGSATFAVGTPSSLIVTATGFPAPALGESGSLPAGVLFDPSTGLLSGTPTSSGVFSITFTASNTVGSVTQDFTLTVNQAPAITSASSATFTMGVPASFTVAATGFPVPTLSEMGILPGGVSFADNHYGTGTLSGTPTSSGTFNVSFAAANGVGSSATQTFTLTVSGSPGGTGLTVSPTSLDFGSLPLLHLGTRQVTVQNTGTAAVAINNISLSYGPHTLLADFFFLTSCHASLPAGKTCVIDVFYFADDLGTHTATLKINDSASTGPQLVSLTGTATK